MRKRDGDSFDWLILADAGKDLAGIGGSMRSRLSETKEQEKPESLKEPEPLIYTFKLHKAP